MKSSTKITPIEFEGSLIPGLTDDVAKHCLALVPRVHFQSLGSVCKSWRKLIQSEEFYVVRKYAGTREEWLYVLVEDSYNMCSQWQVLNNLKGKWQCLPPMPGPSRTSFGFVVVDAKLLIIAGLMKDGGNASKASADVYEYDSFLNRWRKLAEMNVARYEFACAVLDGVVYAIGGHGESGENLSSVEVFDLCKNKWSLIEGLRYPRWGCFACGIEGKVYVMGGRSSFTIGHSRSIDVYDPKSCSWAEVKNGCVMVTAHAILGKKLLCMEWKNEKELAVFNVSENSWKRVILPFTGRLTVGFCFGKFNEKLFLFSSKKEPYYRTLVYDPTADPGLAWQTTHVRPLGACICSVTIIG